MKIKKMVQCQCHGAAQEDPDPQVYCGPAGSSPVMKTSGEDPNFYHRTLSEKVPVPDPHH